MLFRSAEKDGTCRSNLTRIGGSVSGAGNSGSGNSASTGSTNISDTNSTNTDTSATDTTESQAAVEDYAKNKIAARVAFSESMRKWFTFTLKVPGEYKNLHTNSFCMFMMSEKFVLENMPTIGKKLNGKFTRYVGYEKNRYYIEKVVVNCNPSTGLSTELTLNPFASDYSTFAKTQLQAEEALNSALGGSGVGNANGADCPNNTSRTGDISVGYRGSATAQTPTAKALKVVGNSSANYAQLAAAHNTPQSLLYAVWKKHTYIRYENNRPGDCPRDMYAKGHFDCNCAGYAWLMKCLFDCKGWKNYILHGSPAGTGHYWNCVQYNGQWIMGDICYWKYSHNQLSKMV